MVITGNVLTHWRIQNPAYRPSGIYLKRILRRYLVRDRGLVIKSIYSDPYISDTLYTVELTSGTQSHFSGHKRTKNEQYLFFVFEIICLAKVSDQCARRLVNNLSFIFINSHKQ